jgi:hypothetical protein
LLYPGVNCVYFISCPFVHVSRDGPYPARPISSLRLKWFWAAKARLTCPCNLYRPNSADFVVTLAVDMKAASVGVPGRFQRYPFGRCGAHHLDAVPLGIKYITL